MHSFLNQLSNNSSQTIFQTTYPLQNPSPSQPTFVLNSLQNPSPFQPSFVFSNTPLKLKILNFIPTESDVQAKEYVRFAYLTLKWMLPSHVKRNSKLTSMPPTDASNVGVLEFYFFILIKLYFTLFLYYFILVIYL